MARKEPEKEATLGEVLSEVSLADVGRMSKSGLATMGCWAVFMVIVLVIVSVTDSAGIGFDKVGVPDWVVWLIIGWFYVYTATSQRSFHELKMSGYFPKLGWFSSLLLTGYAVGFGYLINAVFQMPVGVERGAAFFAVSCGYTAPLIAFISVINAGYVKLMDKRRASLTSLQPSDVADEW